MDEHCSTRKWIIRMFEGLCIFGAYATVIAAGVAGVVAYYYSGVHLITAILIPIAGYVAATLIFGGALTLVDIARSLDRLLAMAAKAEASEPPGPAV